MQLTSGITFWTQREGPPASYAPLGGDQQCEVAIIGGGITGALCAHYLTQAGVNILLVDRRIPCTGSTSASTGLLQYELDTPLVTLISRLGRDDAFAVYRLSEKALHRMEELVGSLDDASGLKRMQSLYLASSDQDAKTLEDETAARQACGLGATFLSGEALRERFGLHRPAAIHSPFALEVDPYRLTQELLRLAAAGGARIHGNTAITEYEPAGDRVRLRSDRGGTIHARRVIFATGYETPGFVRLNVRLRSTYALVSQPNLPGASLLKDYMLWESARPYLYARSAPEGRAMVGGEDIDAIDASVRDRLIPQKAQRLVSKFQDLFPDARVLPEITWAGTFAETPDGLPLIGSSPQFPLGVFCLGYGGNGITFSLIAAEMVRDTLLGRPSPAQHLFRLDRQSLS